MNHNQRYEARMGFPGYEGSPYGIPRSIIRGAEERAMNRTTTNASGIGVHSYKRGRSYKPHLLRKGIISEVLCFL